MYAGVIIAIIIPIIMNVFN